MHSPTPARVSSLGPIPAPDVVGASAALHRVLRVAERLAAGDSKVLITGESGVGTVSYTHLTLPTILRV